MADGELAQGVVDLKDFGAVDALRIFRGDDAALGDIAGGEVGGKFTRIELVLQADLHGVAGEGDGAEGGDFGRDASDARNEEVGFCEVEERGKSQGGHGASGVDFLRGRIRAWLANLEWLGGMRWAYHFRRSRLGRFHRSGYSARLDKAVRGQGR